MDGILVWKIRRRPGGRSVVKFIGYVLSLLLYFYPVVGQAADLHAGRYTNLDSRPLTAKEDAIFTRLACPAGVKPRPVGEPISCQALAHRQISWNPYTGTTFNMAFKSIMYGHFTDATSIQAFIQYNSADEGNLANFGGGILFELRQDGWQLIRWYPAITYDNCLQLNPDRRAKMLCNAQIIGSEVVSRILIITIPLKPITRFADYATGVLAGVDDRQMGDDANGACPDVGDPKHETLIVVDALKRSKKHGVFASANVLYLKPSTVITFCAKGQFAEAPLTRGIVDLVWNRADITIRSSHTFIPLDYSTGW